MSFKGNALISYYLFISRFGFKSGICLLIAPVPVHCFSIAFKVRFNLQNEQILCIYKADDMHFDKGIEMASYHRKNIQTQQMQCNKYRNSEYTNL